MSRLDVAESSPGLFASGELGQGRALRGEPEPGMATYLRGRSRPDQAVSVALGGRIGEAYSQPGVVVEAR